MRRLLSYAAVIYDSNCIISFCFYHEAPRRSGPPLIIQEHNTLTPLVRLVTETLAANHKVIKTTRRVFSEVEPLLADVVRRRTSEDEVRTSVGLRRGEPFPHELLFAILRKCSKTLRKFEFRDGLEIEDFQAPYSLMEETRRFFVGVASDGTLRARLALRKDPRPGDADLELMVYSRERAAPILTNDTHFTAFCQELKSAGLVAEVVPLSSVDIR